MWLSLSPIYLYRPIINGSQNKVAEINGMEITAGILEDSSPEKLVAAYKAEDYGGKAMI